MTTEKEFFYTSKRVNFTWIIFWGLKIYNYHKKKHLEITSRCPRKKIV